MKELVWKLDEQAWKDVKRVGKLRLQCSMRNLSGDSVSDLGYLILPLSLTTYEAQYKPLMGVSTTSALRPEIRIGLRLSMLDEVEDPVPPEADVESSQGSQILDQLSIHDQSEIQQPVDKGPWHQYRIGIDLKSLHTPQFPPTSVYLTYYYSPFTPKLPISTYPPIVAGMPSQEVLLPQSFNAWEFVMGKSDVQRFLGADGLMIELWVRSSDGKDEQIASSTVDVAKVMQTQSRAWSESPRKNKSMLSKNVKMQVLDEIYDLEWAQDLTGYDREVGRGGVGPARVRVIISLEDFGMIDENLDSEELESAEHFNSVNPERRVDFHETVTEMEDVRETMIQQEIHHEPEVPFWVKEQEVSYMEKLNDMSREWKDKIKSKLALKQQRADERFHEQLQSVTDVEQSLRKFLLEMTTRESKLKILEDDLKLRMKSVEDHSKSRSAQLTQHYKDQVLQAKREVDDVLKKKSITKGQVADLESELLSLEKRVQDARKQVSKMREAHMKSQAVTLTNEQQSVKRLIERLKQEIQLQQGSKNRFKSQWNAAVEDLRKLTESIIADVDATVEAENEKVIEIKWRKIIAQYHDTLDQDRKVLSEIRQQVASLTNNRNTAAVTAEWTHLSKSNVKYGEVNREDFENVAT